MRLILASRSPRRADLLHAAGFELEVVPVDADEARVAGEAPHGYVNRLATTKAAVAVGKRPGRIIVAADTVVLVAEQLLGKPASDEMAADMLRALSGRWHDVLTGVAVRRDQQVAHEVEVTKVRFADLDERAIRWYVATGEPRDKAGAYAIQGQASRFVDRIEGSYTNIVGLPIATVHRLMRAFVD